MAVTVTTSLGASRASGRTVREISPVRASMSNPAGRSGAVKVSGAPVPPVTRTWSDTSSPGWFSWSSGRTIVNGDCWSCDGVSPTGEGGPTTAGGFTSQKKTWLPLYVPSVAVTVVRSGTLEAVPAAMVPVINPVFGSSARPPGRVSAW